MFITIFRKFCRNQTLKIKLYDEKTKKKFHIFFEATEFS